MLLPGLVFLKHVLVPKLLSYPVHDLLGIAFFQKHVRVEDADLKRVREDLQNRVDFLRKQADVSPRLLIVSDCFIPFCMNFYCLLCLSSCLVYISELR